MLLPRFSSHLNIWSGLTWLQCSVILWKCGQNKCLPGSNIWHKTLVKHPFGIKLIKSSPLHHCHQPSFRQRSWVWNWLQTNVTWASQYWPGNIETCVQFVMSTIPDAHGNDSSGIFYILAHCIGECVSLLSGLNDNKNDHLVGQLWVKYTRYQLDWPSLLYK